jgi:hypothetical protein
MATLTARLAALEQAAAPENTRIIWLTVCTARKDTAPMSDDDVMGCHSMGRKVTRLPGESLAAMKARAVRLVPDAALWMVVNGSRESSMALFEGCTEAPMLH